MLHKHFFEYFQVSILCIELTEYSSLKSLSGQFNSPLTPRVSTVRFHHVLHAIALSLSPQPIGIVIAYKELT